MPGWTLLDAPSSVRGRTFRRPLDPLESSYVWDGFVNGSTDTIQHVQLRLVNGPQDAHLFSEANIVRAWLSTKRRYPLAGATVQGPDGPLQVDLAQGYTTTPYFVVREHDLAVLQPHEIVFDQVTCGEEVEKRLVAILHGPRSLSRDLLVQAYFFREKTDVLHLMVSIAHCVTDGIGNFTFMRCLLDTLARGVSGVEPVQVPLEERLAMAISSVDLEPIHLRALSTARQRWRRAAGFVVYKLRLEKKQGGHTLPCRMTRSTPYIPSRPCRLAVSLTHAQTTAVMKNCRLHDITFGNAYFVLGQVAMTRVLYRRYLQGEISEEEWAYRKRQPYTTRGPLNLRPHLDKAWFDRGGGGEFMLSINFFQYELPQMSLGQYQERHCRSERVLSDGAPPFSELLTFEQFLHRAGLVKKQAMEHFSHPLFYEILRAVGVLRTERTRLGALQSMKLFQTANEDHAQKNPDDSDEGLAAMDIPAIVAHTGSTLGNVDFMCPFAYPIPLTHQLSPYTSASHPLKAGYVASPPTAPCASVANMPKIVVENSKVHFHTRPGELYLGAEGTRGRLNMYAHYDSNVFEEGTVKEWVDEMRGAVLWYLGQAHGGLQHYGDSSQEGIRLKSQL